MTERKFELTEKDRDEIIYLLKNDFFISVRNMLMQLKEVEKNEN